MIYKDTIPDITELYPLFVDSGWNEKLNLNPQDLDTAVRNSFAVISVYENNELIGFGRLISDGVVYATIHDVVVAPNWQQQGIGSSIIRKLVMTCQHHDIHSLHLFANKGSESFYQHLGFVSRRADSPGMMYEKI